VHHEHKQAKEEQLKHQSMTRKPLKWQKITTIEFLTLNANLCWLQQWFQPLNIVLLQQVHHEHKQAKEEQLKHQSMTRKPLKWQKITTIEFLTLNANHVGLCHSYSPCSPAVGTDTMTDRISIWYKQNKGVPGTKWSSSGHPWKPYSHCWCEIWVDNCIYMTTWLV
jgi:hypothetical protein